MNNETDLPVNNDILIVDDSKTNLELLLTILQKAGYKVHPANTEELALRSAKAKLPALILLDVSLPGTDGFEVCRKLKSDEAIRGIPIIFISVLEDEASKVKGFQVGGVDYINKPFYPEELLARISVHINLRKARLEREIQNVKLQEEIEIRKNVEESGQLILDSSPTWIFYKDKENRFVRVNKTFASAMGMNREELEGQSAFNIYPKKQADDFWRDDKEIIASGKPKNGIIETVQLKNEQRLVQTDKIPYRDKQGNIIGIIGFSIDITMLKKAEDSLKKSVLELEVNNNKLAELSITDMLTGIHNRRYVLRQIELAIYNFDRYAVPFCLSIIDIDFFKCINDKHGHLLGDKVLITFAQFLKESARKSDIVGRIGGDEFACILPYTTLDKGLIVMNKLRENVKNITLDFTLEKEIAISGGICEYQAAYSLEEIIGKTDNLLYKAKENGRDKIEG